MKNNKHEKHLVAGLLEDGTIEFFALKKLKIVKFIVGGRVYSFSELPAQVYAHLQNSYYRDLAAVSILSKMSPSVVRQVELYTYYMYGDLDCIPDFEAGALAPNENFREHRACISRNFSSKKFKVNGQDLNDRDITILDFIAMDALDTSIAQSLGITTSTLGFHKKNLFIKLDSQTKTALLYKSMRDKLIR
jgi:DNA-binding CsgD family transcriptional regulator